MSKALASCRLAKSQLRRLLIIILLMLNRLSGLVGYQWVSHRSDGYGELGHFVIIPYFHLIRINRNSIISAQKLTFRIVLFWVININTVDIFLVGDEALIKVDRTVWRFSFSIWSSLVYGALKRRMIYSLLFGCTVGSLFSVLHVILGCHCFKRFWCVDVLITLLLYFLANFSSNLL